MVKLTDVAAVAAKAGCSVTTVSRVINNYGYISQKTRKKVPTRSSVLSMQMEEL